MQHDGSRLQQAEKKIGRFASGHQQFAAVDETADRLVGRASLRANGRARHSVRAGRQFQADFEIFGELTVEDGVLARQNAGQPMAHELQDEFALALALKLLS
jgi:hypothetical protein